MQRNRDELVASARAVVPSKASTLASIRLASRSSSSVVTAATLRVPIAGNMYTRCIDSQFSR